MTKRDFEFIAAVLADAESRVCESDLNVRLAVRGVAYMFGIELQKNHPRFNRGIFEKAALPIYHAQMKKATETNLRKLSDENR